MFRFVSLFLLIAAMSQSLTAQSSLHDFTMTTIDGSERSLADYEGKVILVVNVASRCGLTPQYEDLQTLYEQYEAKGLVILGFPANNFAGQEPGSNDQIAEFCQKNYGVGFPMFAKISVKGKDRHPLYTFLDETTGEQPGWNFHKYLIDQNGKPVQSISSRIRVTEAKVVEAIETLLARS